MTKRSYDLAIVGAGIVGLAHAFVASALGKTVIVIDRDARAVGASIRNFGFVTVTGQRRGETWARAMRTREVWQDVAAAARIPILQRGLLVTARRPQSQAVLEAFLETEMGEDCALLSGSEIHNRHPTAFNRDLVCGLWSAHELRVESRDAIPQLAAFLAERGVEFLRSTAVHSVAPPHLETSRGRIEAEAIIVCPGDDLTTLYADRIAAHGVTRCKLQMLRLSEPGFRLPASVMSDLGLVRYRGYADLPQAATLLSVLESEQSQHLRDGVHLIVVQSADGSLVVGDSHHYYDTPEPFAPVAVDDLVLQEYARVFSAPPPPVVEHWTGTYSSAAKDMFMDAPEPAVRIVMITCGAGASTAFAIAEETIADLYGMKAGI